MMNQANIVVEAESGQAGASAKKTSKSSSRENSYSGIGEEASKYEVWGWYLYEFCSYFVQTVLIPILFPLIIIQLQKLPTDPILEWQQNHQGMVCAEKEVHL